MTVEHQLPIRSDSIVTLVDAEVFDDVQAAYSSAELDCTRARKGLMHLDIDSTLTPTDLRFILQFSPDGGTTWHDYIEGPWHSLYYEDQDVAGRVYECLGFDVLGRLMRLRVVATGTDASNKFTVTANVELMS